MTKVPKQETVGIEINFNPKIDHPDVPVSWCIHPETLKEVMHYPEDWSLLISAAQHDRRGRIIFEHREIFNDIRTAINFFRFYRAGKYTIQAMLVNQAYSNKNSRKQFRKLLEKDGAHSYQYDIGFSKENPTERDFGNYIYLSHPYEMDVEIPDEIFAKEPPQWLKNWVNLWSRWGPEDQCAFRKRFVFAFTVQLVLFPILEFFKRAVTFVLGILALLTGRWSGMRLLKLAFRLQWQYAYPEAEIDDVFAEYQVPVFWRGWLFLARPIMLLIYAIVAMILWKFFLPQIMWTIGLLMALGPWAISIGIGFGIIWFLRISTKKRREEFFARFSAERKKILEQRQATAEEKFALRVAERTAEAETYLGCGIAPSITTAKLESPSARRSLILQFRSAKRKVCRPFAS